MAHSQTVGMRLARIRLDCGDGRKAEPLPRFAERVKKATGEWYDPTAISKLERMEQGWRLRMSPRLRPSTRSAAVNRGWPTAFSLMRPRSI